MANYILKELPGEMTEGRRVICPKMKRFSLSDYAAATGLSMSGASKRPQANSG
jgi:hypothetical protein